MEKCCLTREIVCNTLSKHYMKYYVFDSQFKISHTRGLKLKWENARSARLSIIPEIKDITDYYQSKPMFDKKYHTLIQNRDVCLNSIPDGTGGVYFFSDVSKCRGAVGFDVYSNDLNLSKARRLLYH